MTTVIDERVVEMRFNNADFEKNVAQSMSTLEKLKSSLNFDSAKSLENIGKVSKNFSMENVGSQVEAVQAKFSAMQIVGITAISELTKAAMHLGATLVSKVLGPITSGGMTRAQNIENAKFMLEGLNVAWDDIKDDINYGVKDTAYGLDQAAKAASQLVASNVKIGDSMKTALRGISGVAAMTNRSYDDIADIFTDVAGKGRLMSAELTRLSERGLNAAAVLAKAFGTTEAGVREMAKKGEISFEMFSKAMDDAFGEHAKDANKTFNGAMSNVRAALSRIGAEFATPYMENMRKIFVSLIDVINGVNKAMKPIYDDVSAVMDLMSQATRKFLESEGLQKSIPLIVNAASQAFKGLFIIITTVREAFRSVFPYDAGALILKIATAINTFVEKVLSLTLTKDILADIYIFFKGISSVIKAVITVFKTLFQVIVPVEKPLEFILKTVFDIFGFIGYILNTVSGFITQNATVVNFLQTAASVFATVVEVLSKVALVLGGAAFIAISKFVSLLQKAITSIKPFIDTIGPKVAGVGNKISSTFSKLTGVFSGFNKQTKASTESVKGMATAYGSAGTAVGNLGNKIDNTTSKVAENQTVLGRFLIFFNNVKNVIVTVVTVIAGGVLAIGKNLFTFFTDFRARFKDITSGATNAFDYIKGFFKTIGSMLPDIGRKVSDFLAQFGIDTSSIGKAIMDVVNKVTTFVQSVGTGRIAAIAFAGAMLVLIINISRLSEQFIGLVMNLKGIVYNIKNLFNFNKTNNVNAVAKAILMIAGALTVLAVVNENYDLKEATNQLLKVMAAFAAMVLVLKGMDLLIPRLNFTRKEYTRINEIIFAFAAAIGVITAAIVVLNRVQLKDDWMKKLGLMAAMLVEFGIAVAIISKISPTLSKGSILLLSLALSMKLIVDSLAKLGEKDIDGINKNMKGFALMFVGVAAMTAAAGQIRVTSALSLIVVAKALQLMFPVLKDLIQEIAPYISEIADKFEKVSLDLDKLKEGVKSIFEKANNFFDYVAKRFGETQAIALACTSLIAGAAMFTTIVGGIVGLGVAIGTIISAIGSLGNVLKGAAIAVIGVAVAIRIVTSSVIELSDYFRSISNADVQNCLAGVAIIATSLVAVVGLLTLIDAVTTIWAQSALVQQKRTSFVGIAAAVIGVGAAMLLIVKAMEAMQGIDADKLKPLTIAMASLLVALGVAAAGAGMIKKGVPVILGMVGVCLAIALLLAEVAILSTMWTDENKPALIAALVVVEIFLASIAVIVGLATKLKGGLPALGVIASIAAMLGLVMGSLIAVGHYQLSLGTVLATLGGMTAIIVAITVLVRQLTKPELLAHIDTIKTKLFALIAVVASMAILSAALKSLASVTTGWQAIVSAVLALTAGMMVAYGLLNVINKMKINPGLLSKVLALVGIVASIWVLAQAIKVLAGLKDIPMTRIWSSMAALMVGMGVLTAFSAVIIGASNTIKGAAGVVGMLILFAGICGTIWSLASAITMLADLDTNRLWQSFAVIGIMTVLMGALVGLIGYLQIALVGIGSGLGSAAGGWAGAMAIPLVLVALGAAIISISYALKIGCEALELLSKAINLYLIPALTALANMDLKSLVQNLSDLAAPLIACGYAFGVFGVGAGVGAGGILLLAFALSKLVPSLGPFADGMRDIAAIDIGSIAKDLIVLAVAAAALGSTAVGVGAFGVAIGGLASALGQYSGAFYGEPEGSSLHTSGSGRSHGGSSGFFGGLRKETDQTTQYVEEKAHTVTHTIAEANDGLQQEIITGTVTAKNTVKQGTGEIVTIIDEDVAKAGDVAETGVNKVSDKVTTGVERTTDKAAKAAEKGGEKIGKAVPTGYERMIGQADTSTPTERLIDSTLDKAGTKISQGIDTLGGDIQTWFQNGGISEFFASMGLDMGKLTGGQWKEGFMGEIAGILGMQGAIFKQMGWKNYAGQEISQFGAGGMPTDVMAKQYGTLKGNIVDAAKQNGLFNGVLTETGKVLTDLIPKFDGATGGAEGLAEAEEKAGKGAKNMAKDLKSTLEGQLDMFSKFEIKTEMSSKTLLENMESNINGFASWSHRMTVLAERFAEHGISDTLYKKLAEMGPKGYETMNAIYTMTDEELEKLKGLWETGLTLPEGQADIVASGFTYMGEMATQGFSNALDDHKAAHEAAHGLGKAALDGMKEVLDVHSPSQEAFKIGVEFDNGFGKGITSASGLAMIELCVSQVAQKIIDLFTEKLSPENAGLIGDNLLDALFSNVLGGASEENPIISAFTQGLMVLEPVYSALTMFVEAVTSKLNEGFRMDGSASPSLLFYEYGTSSIQGYANGISNNISYVKFAIAVLVTAALGTLNAKNLPSKFYDIGKNATMGFANGLADSEACESVMRKAREIAEAAAEEMAKGLKESSPSKVTRQIGKYASEGLAIGIADGADTVYRAAQSVTEDAISGLNDVGRIQEVLNNELDFNPVITPILDLSILREQMAEVNSMFAAGAYTPYSQNGGQFTATPETTQQITFTQNNYSPKELSRYDIYRNTKNQISMMKGVMRANG